MGCLLFYLSYNKHPFPNGGSAKIVSANYDIPDLEDCILSRSLRELVISILKAGNVRCFCGSDDDMLDDPNLELIGLGD